MDTLMGWILILLFVVGIVVFFKRRRERRQEDFPARPTNATKTMSAALVEGPKLENGQWAYDYCVVGESHYQPTLRRQADQGTEALTMVLIREPDNKYDKNAVAVYAPAGKIGHIPKEDAPALVAHLKRLEKKYKCPVAVYGRIGSGSNGIYGAFLSWPDKWE